MNSGYRHHPTAVIDEGAEIGPGSNIWHFSHVCSGAKIGSNVTVGQNVYIGSKAVIGDGCKVQNNVSVYDNVTLEEGVFCGPSVVFTNVINPRAFIERKTEYMPTLVRKGATLGANCTIVCGVSIGEYALVGAGAVVTRDVAAFSLVAGSPARPIGWVSKGGHRLNLPVSGQAEATCEATGERYLLSGSVVRLKAE